MEYNIKLIIYTLVVSATSSNQKGPQIQQEKWDPLNEYRLGYQSYLFLYYASRSSTHS